jgi:hypothetical protein
MQGTISMASMLKNMIRMGMLPDNTPRDACPKQEQSSHPESNPCQELVPFISTPLDIHYADTSQPDDITIEGIIFRKLSPDYFAWFRSRMVLAQAAHKAGKLPDTAWETLRERFNSLQEIAIEIFDKETLQQALRDFNPKSYTPPMAPIADPAISAETVRKDWLYPASQAWKCRQKVTSEAVAKVDVIRDEAMAKGWSEARLYQNQGRFRFPCGEDYGLVCFVDGSRRIGEITTKYIEVISETAGRENRLRFFNPDVDQPWLKRTESNK